MHTKETFDGVGSIPSGWTYEKEGQINSNLAFRETPNGNGYIDFTMGAGADCWGTNQLCAKLFVPQPEGLIDGTREHRGNSWTA